MKNWDSLWWRFHPGNPLDHTQLQSGEAPGLSSGHGGGLGFLWGWT